MFSVALFGLIATIGCKKSLDVNVDPNNASVEQGTPSVVFPAAVFGTTAAVGGEFAILGSMWGQYVTQSAFSNQYKTIDAYQLSSSDLNRPYRLSFANGLKNYQFVIDKSKSTANWNYYLMATAMKAYNTQVLVDIYDQIPYFEALKGVNNLSPKFDDGYTIYKDLLNQLDTALSKPIDQSVVTAADITADLVFHGDLDKWQRFANTMKLKLYLRMVNKKPTEAQTGIKKLYTDAVDFLDVDAAVTGFTNVKDKDNPMYDYNIRTLNTPDNLRASVTFSSYLADKNDTRNIYYFGSLNPSAIHQGDYTGTLANYKSAAVLKQNPTDPVIFISEAESYFMQAEAKERYYGGNGSKVLYDNGVLASFTATGGDGSSFIATGGGYEYPAAGTLDDKIKAIITQKWISSAYGVHFIEGFLEKNRTGYPKTSIVYSTDPNYVPGQFVISKNSTLGVGKLPKRLVFPDAEKQTNSNTPTQVPITTSVWWAL